MDLSEFTELKPYRFYLKGGYVFEGILTRKEIESDIERILVTVEEKKKKRQVFINVESIVAVMRISD